MTTLHVGHKEPETKRRIGRSLWRGLSGRCPNCASKSLFHAYLKVSDQCGTCGEALHHHRADDAPAYFSIMVVGHVIVPLAVILERGWQPPMWLHMSLWLPLSLILALISLPAIKGALVNLQWALRMHGFGNEEESEGRLPISDPATHP